MKREINLLSPSARKNRMRRLYGDRFNRLFLVFFAGLVVILIVYGVSFYGLSYFGNMLNESLPSVESVVSAPENEVISINEEFELFGERVESLELWTDDIGDVFEAVPEGMTITEVQLKEPLMEDESGSTLIIDGRSASRSSIVAFQRTLQDLDWVGRVEAPLKNYAGGEDAEFRFTLFRNGK